MNTATEIEIRREEVARKIVAVSAVMEKIANDFASQLYNTAFSMRRHVSAKRARKLRRRGEAVAYCGRTSTGKARYTWTMRVAPWAIYRQPPQEQK